MSIDGIDPDRDFERLVVVETGRTRFIGLQRGGHDELVLDYTLGLTVVPTSQGMAPGLASLDFCQSWIMGVTIIGDHWRYRPKYQDKETQEAFKAEYFGTLELIQKAISRAPQVKGSGITMATPYDLQSLMKNPTGFAK